MRTRENLYKLVLILMVPTMCFCSDGGIAGTMDFEEYFQGAKYCVWRECMWDLEQGELDLEAPTWHENDYAMGLKGPLVALTAKIDVSHEDASCFVVEVKADKDDQVALFVEADFLDDGHVEMRIPVPAVDWEHSRFQITAPTWFEGVRFRLKKEGTGRAVLLFVFVRDADTCAADPVELNHRPPGAPCESDSQCLSGDCTEDGVCG